MVVWAFLWFFAVRIRLAGFDAQYETIILTYLLVYLALASALMITDLALALI